MPSGTHRSIAARVAAFPSRLANGFIQGTNLALTPWARCSPTFIRPDHACARSAFKAFLGLCGREKRGTVERDRYRGPHHHEQNAHASRGVESLERAHEIGKRSRQDPNCLPSGETGIEER